MEKEYWDNRWVNQQLGWDLGHVSTPLKEFFDTIENKQIRILIPGAGNSYEAEYLNRIGFNNVFVVDISAHAVRSFKERYPDFPAEHIMNVDFFKLKDQFDLIIEQTFFCSLHPSRRSEYAKKMSKLLTDDGLVAGVMFDRSFDAGPPFGGCKVDYLEIFSPYFSDITMTPCKNSVKPRLGTELWVEMKK